MPAAGAAFGVRSGQGRGPSGGGTRSWTGAFRLCRAVGRPGPGGPQASGAAAQVLGRTDYHRFDNLGHCLIVDHGWTDLADYSLTRRGRYPSRAPVRLAQAWAQ